MLLFVCLPICTISTNKLPLNRSKPICIGPHTTLSKCVCVLFLCECNISSSIILAHCRSEQKRDQRRVGNMLERVLLYSYPKITILNILKSTRINKKKHREKIHCLMARRVMSYYINIPNIHILGHPF